MVGSAGVVGAFVTRSIPLYAFAPIRIDVYATPACGCGKQWIAHLNSNGFGVVAHGVASIDPINTKLGIPVALQGCEAAVVGPYAITGPVPADLIQQLLSQKPAHIVGLAVPGCPAGSPGMASQKKVSYSVLAFERNGTTHLFAKR
jgi:hypothetical protein